MASKLKIGCVLLVGSQALGGCVKGLGLTDGTDAQVEDGGGGSGGYYLTGTGGHPPGTGGGGGGGFIGDVPGFSVGTGGAFITGTGGSWPIGTADFGGQGGLGGADP